MLIFFIVCTNKTEFIDPKIYAEIGVRRSQDNRHDAPFVLSMRANLLKMIVDTMTALFRWTLTIDQSFDTQLIR